MVKISKRNNNWFFILLLINLFLVYFIFHLFIFYFFRNIKRDEYLTQILLPFQFYLHAKDNKLNFIIQTKIKVYVINGYVIYN